MYKKIIISFVIGLLIGGGVTIAVFFFQGKSEKQYRELINAANDRADNITKQFAEQQELNNKLKRELDSLAGYGSKLASSNDDDVKRVQRIIDIANEIKREFDSGN